MCTRNASFFHDASFISTQATNNNNKNILSPWLMMTTAATIPSITSTCFTVSCSSKLHRQVNNHRCRICKEKLPFPPIFTKIQQLRYNLQHCQPQSTNGSDNDIYCIITIYQDVVSTIKQNCRMHLLNMICQRCKDIHWLLEGGQEPRSMADVWRILRTKQYMIRADGGVQYFSYTYYIIRSLSYTMNNSWVHKGVVDAVSK